MPSPLPPSESKDGLHPRNPHRAPYDFPALVKACPELRGLLRPRPGGGETVDFADPRAVKLLNRALLQTTYGIRGWDLPEGYLCPPIPGRADLIHHVADLLLGEDGRPEQEGVRVLDLGTGANGVYALLGHRTFGWKVVGTDIDGEALASLRRVLRANPGLEDAISLRLQEDRRRIFQGVVRPGERFDLSLCNPPFHASKYEARAGTERKWRNLGREAQGRSLNFGGQGGELWCPGGELAFIGRMIEESLAFKDQVRWFTTLVAKSAHLGRLQHALRQHDLVEQRVIEMAQGQKRSRVLAWTFLPGGRWRT